MSLEATHIRFSLAIKDDLKVINLEKYVSGAIYPDTRYKSGINRNLTHNLGYFEGRRNLSDFEKGWFSHILGDKVFYETIEKKFGSWLLSEDLHEQGVSINAIKIIQDLKDFLSFDIRQVIDLLDYYEIHFHEDERLVIEFNKIIKDMYGDKKKIAVEDCMDMWHKLGRGDEKLLPVRKRIAEFYEDGKLIENIERNFEDGMELYEDKYRNLIKNYAKNQ